MKLHELYSLYQHADFCNDMIQCRWFDWYREKYNIPKGDYSAFNQHFSFEVDKQQQIVICRVGDQTYNVPISAFVQDLNNQPEIILKERWFYYDGPWDGIGTWNGKLMMYDGVEDDFGHREYTAYEISKAQLKIFKGWQRINKVISNIIFWVIHKHVRFSLIPFGWRKKWLMKKKNILGVFCWAQITSREWDKR